MNAWRFTDTGEPAGAHPCPGDPTTLTPTQRTNLIQALHAHQDRWLITGPCLDGGWYAIPRHDKSQLWPTGSTLPDLTHTLDQHRHRPAAPPTHAEPTRADSPPTPTRPLSNHSSTRPRPGLTHTSTGQHPVAVTHTPAHDPPPRPPALHRPLTPTRS
jgi:hypothetical protein